MSVSVPSGFSKSNLSTKGHPWRSLHNLLHPPIKIHENIGWFNNKKFFEPIDRSLPAKFNNGYYQHKIITTMVAATNKL